MNKSFTSNLPLPKFSLWQNLENRRIPSSFDLEITARCNNNCRHCYINLPAADKKAIKEELSFRQLKKISDQAASLGALWCLITGGEPLLRKDFFEIYLYLKKKGILVSVFTNATLITDRHIRLFKEYPPRNIEVTVYGITKETYERVTRAKGSFSLFRRGLNLLLKNKIKVHLKAMALRSNVRELPQIAKFCRKISQDYFRFDPFLHLRLDQNPKRNREIKSERLSAEEIVRLEKSDPKRFQALKEGCKELFSQESAQDYNCHHLFHCGAGNNDFVVGYDGLFRLCSALYHPNCIYDLKKGELFDAWNNFVPKVRNLQSSRKDFLERCRKCSLIDLCFWCPAHAYLEKKKLDVCVDYFCQITTQRINKLRA